MAELADKSSSEWIASLVDPIGNDLLSGAAELALQAITVFQTIMTEKEDSPADELRALLTEAAASLVKVHPAMGPIFHLANSMLISIDEAQTTDQILEKCQTSLDEFEKALCESASKIADTAYELIEPGAMVFAYSFSSTVVSTLLHARSKGRYFRVACTEARPSMEGRKLAASLADGGIEVVHTFDTAMSLVLPNCSVAFMGCDCIARPGMVNKVGSWMLAVACRELRVPLYGLSGLEKLVGDDRLFEFEKHQRPGEEVWDRAPKGIRLLNNQFDLVPFNLLSGLVTDRGLLKESDVEKFMSSYKVHDALRLEPALF